MKPAVCPYLTDHDTPEHMRITKSWRELKAIRGGAPRPKRGSAKTVYECFSEIEAAYLAGEPVSTIARRYNSTFYSVARALAEAGHDIGKV